MEKRRDRSNGAGLRECACNALARLRSRRPVEAHPLGAGRPRTLLEFRIDRHMRMVHRALDQIRELNPKGTTRDELPEEVWDSLAGRGERALLDTVDAEVRFWAAIIAHNPMIRLGEGEAVWVSRVVRLANVIRNSADRRREELAFLRDRFSRGTLTCHRGGEDDMTMDTPLRVEIERLEVKMRSRLGGQVRDLRLVVNGRGFVLLGHARTYYAKQLAQQAAIEGTPLPLLANEIEVRQAVRSDRTGNTQHRFCLHDNQLSSR